jgi:hypothetical protein
LIVLFLLNQGQKKHHAFGLDLWKISNPVQERVADSDFDIDEADLSDDVNDDDPNQKPGNRRGGDVAAGVERAFFLNPIFPERKMLVGSNVKSEWRNTKYVAVGKRFVFEPATPFEFVLHFREKNFMLKWSGVHGKGELIYAYVHPLKDISHIRVYGCAELNTAMFFY